ncbi:hypothetical protein [Rhizorhabdus sp.]|uniref:hypothetical protein n=1 Tax=Rhizorhabdus sp. TaxID=1968843 RepID=UPI001B4AEAF9|nr:hypothetical protein [Rhizorhabdus sp.]MBP8232345.1 hypothetical protein [Rhizorhabdus sp.]
MTRPSLPRYSRNRLAVLLTVVAVAIPAAWFGLANLERSRGDLLRVKMRAVMGRTVPQPLLPQGLGFAGRNRAEAQAAFVSVVRRAAADRRLLLERLAPLPPNARMPAELSADLILSGPEADVLDVVRDLEAGSPLVRFAFWRLARTGPAETAVRLEARAIGWHEG